MQDYSTYKVLLLNSDLQVDKRKLLEINASTKPIYKILKRHGLNVLKCQAKIRRYKRFAMRHPNEMVQMDILGHFYLSNSSQRNYILVV